MTARTWAIAAVALLAVAEGAEAHTVFGMTGFAGGLLHPLAAPAHLTAVVALALLIGQQQWRCVPLFAYAAALIIGLAAIALAYVPYFAEQVLLALAAATGLLVAWARPLPSTVGTALAAATGLVLALDSPPEAISISEANVTLLGVALSAMALLIALACLASLLGRHWQHIGMRIVGSWIAASAIMVLALGPAGG
jgi:urease accessory protein